MGNRLSSPAPALLRASATLVLLILLAVVAAYCAAGLPHVLLVLALLVPFVLALLSPALAVAVALALAPLADGLAALALFGDARLHDAVGISWIEPVVLGVAAALLVRLLRKPDADGVPWAGVGVYTGAMACALAVALGSAALDWRRRLPYFLLLAWRSLPFMNQFTSEHVLRAGLLLLGAAAWLVLVRTTLRDPVDARKAWLGWLVGALATGMYGSRMWWRGEGQVFWRVESLLDDVNSYASYLVLTVFASWAILACDRGRWVRRVAAVALALSAWMLFVSGSRIGLLAVLGGAGAVVAMSARRTRQLVAATVALIAAVVLVTQIAVPDGDKLHDLSDFALGAVNPAVLVRDLEKGRTAVWSASVRAFHEQPVFGLGPGLLFRSLGGYFRDADPGWKPRAENAHDYFLQLAAETGVVGMFGFFWLLFGALRPAFERDGGAFGRRVLGIGALAYLATALTGHPLILARQVVLFWAFVALIPISFTADATTVRPPPWRVGGVALAMLVVAAFVFRTPAIRCPGARDDGPSDWDFTAGFYRVEWDSKGAWRWMREAGQLRICNRLSHGVVADVSLMAGSLVEARAVDVFLNRHRSTIEVGPPVARLTIPGLALQPGWNSLVFVPVPGTRRVDDVLHNGDRRSVSIRFGDPTVVVHKP